MLGLYIREKIKCELYRFLTRITPRVQTPMQQVFFQLQYKGYWNSGSDKKALEMFGMFGLWHTRDYIKQVGQIDFFEIDEKIIHYAKKALKEKVNFYCADSIKYIGETKKKYNLVVADTPYCFTDGFDPNTGIPPFMKDMLCTMSSGGVIIMNLHTEYLHMHHDIYSQIKNMTEREIKDLFYVIRNSMITYVVVVMGK